MSSRSRIQKSPGQKAKNQLRSSQQRYYEHNRKIHQRKSSNERNESSYYHDYHSSNYEQRSIEKSRSSQQKRKQSTKNQNENFRRQSQRISGLKHLVIEETKNVKYQSPVSSSSLSWTQRKSIIIEQYSNEQQDLSQWQGNKYQNNSIYQDNYTNQPKTYTKKDSYCDQEDIILPNQNAINNMDLDLMIFPNRNFAQKQLRQYSEDRIFEIQHRYSEMKHKLFEENLRLKRINRQQKEALNKKNRIEEELILQLEEMEEKVDKLNQRIRFVINNSR